MSSEVSDAVSALVTRYPRIAPGTVRGIVENACATVERNLGRPDLLVALDLAQLRLDVRNAESRMRPAAD